MKVLVPDAVRDAMVPMESVVYITVPASQPIPEEHLDAEVLVAWGQPPHVLEDAARRMTNLKLIQCFLAGPDPVVAAGFAPEIPITSGVGLHDGPVSEHALALTLALIRNLPRALQRQGEHVWEAGLAGSTNPRADDGRVISLEGAQIAIWGFGSIASRLAPLYSSLGANVTGIARSAGERHGYPVVAEAGIASLLSTTDILVMILPQSETTADVLNAERLAQLKPGALLVNVGRGKTVDEEALVEALNSGHLAGAALDVTHTEPLPAESPLWDAPGIIITPHVASMRPQHGGQRLAENIRLLTEGGELIRRVR